MHVALRKTTFNLYFSNKLLLQVEKITKLRLGSVVAGAILHGKQSFRKGLWRALDSWHNAMHVKVVAGFLLILTSPECADLSSPGSRGSLLSAKQTCTGWGGHCRCPSIVVPTLFEVPSALPWSCKNDCRWLRDVFMFFLWGEMLLTSRRPFTCSALWKKKNNAFFVPCEIFQGRRELLKATWHSCSFLSLLMSTMYSL